ncbi:MAG TPA: hypothetical protein VFP12_15665 [Allosphingosinicella sp.]|nr:hypothetical protein [Allosphingosinicella sp.]
MTVGSIISGGFRLIREHPGAVAVWALLYLVVTVGMTFIMRPVFGGALDGGRPAAADLSAMMGVILLFQLFSMLLLVALLAASQRAVLDPERQGFAFLRFGLDELRLIGLTIVFAIVFYVGMIVAIILMTLVTGLAVVAGGPVVAIPLAVIEMLAMFGVVIWLQVRLSLAFPLTLMRDRIVIGEAWRLTRSRFWTLFLAYLVISLLLLVVWIAAALLTNGSYLAELARSGFDPQAIEAAGERQMAKYLGAITLANVIGWVVTAAAAAFGIALFGGAVATAALELTEDVDVLAETFA